MADKDRSVLPGISLSGGEHAVLLVHGLTGSPQELRFLAKRLNQAGYTVQVPYLAGHGTDLKDLMKTTWQDWHASMRDVFCSLAKTYSTVSVAGLCMGAVIALHLAHEFPEKIPAVALLSTTLFYDGWTVPWYTFLLPYAYYTPLRYFYTYPETEPYGVKNEKIRQRIKKSLDEEAGAYAKFPLSSMAEHLRMNRYVRKLMPAIMTPALIIHSHEDDMASVKNAEYLQQHLGSTVVRTVLLDDCYHMITVDNQREQVAQELIDFLNARLVVSSENCH